jgi:beta-galactosidase
LAQLGELVESCNQAEVALIYDLQNEWALNLAQLPRSEEKLYQERCMAHYQPWWQQGITVDMIDSATADLSPYKLIIAPMLYMLREGVVRRLEDFVRQGGTLVMTYLSGLVDAHDLCFTGDFPLRSLLGLWVEETDSLFAHTVQTLQATAGNEWGLRASYPVSHYADIVHLDGAQAIAHYGHDYYAGRPGMTVNQYGRGRAFYLAARPDSHLLPDFYSSLSHHLGLAGALPGPLPVGVSAQVRADGRQKVLFLMNFETATQTIELGACPYQDVLTAERVSGVLQLEGYGWRVLRPDGTE